MNDLTERALKNERKQQELRMRNVARPEAEREECKARIAEIDAYLKAHR